MAKPMVVGVDGTADSLCALSAAAELAEESGASLVVVHVRHESGVVAANSALAGAGVGINEALDEVGQMSRQRGADVLAGRRGERRVWGASGGPPPQADGGGPPPPAGTHVVRRRTPRHLAG